MSAFIRITLNTLLIALCAYLAWMGYSIYNYVQGHNLPLYGTAAIAAYLSYLAIPMTWISCRSAINEHFGDK